MRLPAVVSFLFFTFLSHGSCHGCNATTDPLTMHHSGYLKAETNQTQPIAFIQEPTQRAVETTTVFQTQTITTTVKVAETHQNMSAKISSLAPTDAAATVATQVRTKMFPVNAAVEISTTMPADKMVPLVFLGLETASTPTSTIQQTDASSSILTSSLTGLQEIYTQPDFKHIVPEKIIQMHRSLDAGTVAMTATPVSFATSFNATTKAVAAEKAPEATYVLASSTPKL